MCISSKYHLIRHSTFNKWCGWLSSRRRRRRCSSSCRYETKSINFTSTNNITKLCTIVYICVEVYSQCRSSGRQINKTFNYISSIESCVVFLFYFFFSFLKLKNRCVCCERWEKETECDSNVCLLCMALVMVSWPVIDGHIALPWHIYICIPHPKHEHLNYLLWANDFYWFLFLDIIHCTFTNDMLL